MKSKCTNLQLTSKLAASAVLAVGICGMVNAQSADKTKTAANNAVLSAVGNGVKSNSGPLAIGGGTTVVNFDVAGILSQAGIGNPLNEVFNLDIGGNAQVVGVGWDVTLTAFAPSWLSEISVLFTPSDPDSPDGVALSPGAGDDAPGENVAYSSDGILSLVDLDLDFAVDADGVLRLEFFEGFVDFADDPDGEWISGTLSFQIFGGSSPCTGDLNNDGVVNVSDMLILLGEWGSCPGCVSDLNGDGLVNVSDLLILLGNWGSCPAPPDPTGACCFDDGSCTPDLTAAECDDIDGNYGGNFSACGSCPQPPNGETCDLALPMNIGDTVAANTTGNPVGNAPGCGDALAPNAPTVWYSVVGDGTTLTADTCASSVATGTNIAVYCANCDAPLCVAGSTENFDCFDNPFNGSASWCSEDGAVYYIAVWGDGQAGDVSMTVTSNGNTGCTPSVVCSTNDECEVAVDITGNIDGAPVQGDSLNASDGGLPAGSPTCHWQGGGSPVQNVVWYTFTATAEVHTISVCDSTANGGTLVDSNIMIFEGECGSLVEIGCGEDECPTDFLSEAVFATNIGQQYYMALGNPNFGNAGQFSFTITSGGDLPEPCDPENVPDNDLCVNADNAGVLVQDVPVVFTGNNECSTIECASFPTGEGHVWLAFEITETSDVTLSYCGSTGPQGAWGNAWLNLALDCPCTGFTPGAAFNTTACGDGNVTMTWSSLAAGTYYYPVMLQFSTGAIGDYNITVVAGEAGSGPNPNSCVGNCGAQAPGGCWCDEGCCGFGDCCADKFAECGGCDPGGGGGTESCAGACGGQSPDGCWCDDKCDGFGDCCPDICDECPGSVGC